MTRLILPVLTMLSLALASSPTSAQRPTVYRDSVRPNWVSDGGSFWYEVKTSARNKEFIFVDADKGTRAPAFDHQKIAECLSTATGKPLDSNNLPINSLKYSKDLQQVTVSGRSGSWLVDLTSYEATNSSFGSAKTTRFFLPARRSTDKGDDIMFRFTNKLPQDIQLAWAGRSGETTLYHTVKSGKSVEQHTFIGHVWQVQSITGDAIAAFEVGQSQTNVVIEKADLAKVAKSPAPKQNNRRRRRSTSGAQSPDGSATVTVRNHNLWLINKSQPASEVQLSKDGSLENSFQRDASRNRLVETQTNTDDVAPNARWSPDSQHVVAMQTTQVDERIVQFVQSTPPDQLQPTLQSFSYAKPGDRLPTPTPRLFSVANGEEIPVSNALFPDPFRLQFLRWSEDSSRFYLQYNERGHQALRLLEISVADGSVRSVVDENSDTFIQYSSEGKYELHWLPQERLLWASERSGWNHLYRYDVKSGNVINAVTSGDWNVRRIERVDSDAGVVWFYAVGVVAEQDPYHEHFCRVNFDGTEFKVLTEGDGTHTVAMSPDRQYFVDRFSRVDMAAVTEFRRSVDGTLVTKLETGDAAEIVAGRGSLPIRFTAKGRDGKTDIWGLIHLPRNFDPTRKYPVVENIYAGPHDHHVPKAFRTSYRHQHEIADKGVVVVQIDGMGTAWRSKEFHDVCFQNLKDAGFPDRVQWIKAASEQYPHMDISRLGIYGGSAGGQNAMAALLWHNDFYKVAVADCGCHDNRMDKIWWNEQWMGRMGDHYAANSNTENAHLLQGQLMLVVGELDRNVDPATTTQVVAKLIAANKDFDFLLMPGVGHGACERPYASRRRANFLAEHLQAESPAEQ